MTSDDLSFLCLLTPFESLTDRFTGLDTEKFGVVPDITDKEYYTNSFHYDVRKNPTPLKSWTLRRFILKWVLFIHYCEYPVLQQNPALRPSGTMPMIGLAIWEPIRRLIAVTSVTLRETLPTERASPVQTVATAIPRWSMCGRTCGYLGNPQASSNGQRPTIENISRVT